jgi:hypothetical protein
MVASRNGARRALEAVTSVLCSLALLSQVSPAHAAGIGREVWSQRGVALTPSDGIQGEEFGISSATSGDTLVVGSPGTKVGANQYQGAVRVYVRNGSTWLQQGPTLVAPSGAAQDSLGFRVAVSRDTLIASSAWSGYSQVFTRSGSTWSVQGPSLRPAGSNALDFQLPHVFISGDNVVIGATTYNVTGGIRDSVGSYVFSRSDGSWSQQGGKLVPTEGDPYYARYLDAGGLSGNLAAFTGPLSKGGNTSNAVFLFAPSGASWTQQGPAIVDLEGGFAAGRTVALSGNTLVISGSNGGATDSLVSALAVFVHSEGSWVQQGPSLVLPQVEIRSSAIEGELLLAATNTAFYIFKRNGLTWTQQGGPVTVSPNTNSSLSLAISGRTAIIGDYAATIAGHLQQGAVYFYSSECTLPTDCPASAYCSAGTCLARCEHDSDCDAGSFCPSDGICKPSAAQGGPCDEAAGASCKEAGCKACASGECVDGACCESACEGTCEACVSALTGKPDGSCQPVLAGQDPGDDCAADIGFPASCLADGSCDGKGACRTLAPAGTACGDTLCTVAGVQGQICDGHGLCHADTVACSPYACITQACAVSCHDDTECDGAAYCASGACLAKKAEGVACRTDAECLVGLCSEGVCCTGEGCQRFSCGDDSECSEGDQCVRGACIQAIPGSAGEGGAAGEVGLAGAGGTGNDCAGGNCSTPGGAAGESEPVASANNEQSVSCGCHVAPRASGHLAWLGALALFGVGRRRRASRSRPPHSCPVLR